MSVPRARLLDLMKVWLLFSLQNCPPANQLQAQCQVFATNFNPDGIRMGNKVLRQRLRGPALAAYYPRRVATIKDVRQEFGPGLDTWEDAEEDRFEYIDEYDNSSPEATWLRADTETPD